MSLIDIDKIITDDDLIDFLLDRHKETGDQMFLMAANSVALYRRDFNLLSFCVNKSKEWISVKDELPEKFTNVLCLYPSKNYGSNIVVDYMESDRGYFAEQFRYGEPTHWMPLPTPPTEKEN